MKKVTRPSNSRAKQMALVKRRNKMVLSESKKRRLLSANLAK